jgi:hypothetical protein
MHLSTSYIYLVLVLIAVAFAIYSDLKDRYFASALEVFSAVVTHKTTRFALLIVWWWLGWHFLGSPDAP